MAKKKPNVKIIDGGSRESCPTSKYITKPDARSVEIKASYDTEHVLKSKFEAKIKNDIHHGLNRSTSFSNCCSDEEWAKIFKQKKH